MRTKSSRDERQTEMFSAPKPIEMQPLVEEVKPESPKKELRGKSMDGQTAEAISEMFNQKCYIEGAHVLGLASDRKCEGAMNTLISKVRRIYKGTEKVDRDFILAFANRWKLYNDEESN